MRRYTLYFMLALVFVLAFAVPVIGAGGKHAKATGEAWFSAGGTELYVHFNAHGTDPAKGEVYYENEDDDWFEGDVTCYYQDGDEAAFGGMITGGTYTEGYFLFEVQDNGNGSRGEPDKIRVRTFNTMPVCALSGLFPGVRYMGNVTVH